MDTTIRLNKSRQRDAIIAFLKTRTDHPTADIIYDNLRKDFPKISLGTVYRNLSLLADLGQIKRLSIGDLADHYDYDTSEHCHFVCRQCQSVIDVPMDNLDFLDSLAARSIDGHIEEHSVYFYGECAACRKITKIS